MRPLLGLGFFSAAMMLAAFSPPPGSSEGVQQTTPKSWIPKPKEKPPRFEYHAWEREEKSAPTERKSPTPPTYTLPGFVCDTATLRASSRDFVESYTAAKSAADRRHWNEAITRAEVAAGQAGTAREWFAVEGIRILALTALHADADLVAVLEATLAIDCLSSAQRANYQKQLNAARRRLSNQPQ